LISRMLGRANSFIGLDIFAHLPNLTFSYRIQRSKNLKITNTCV
jgi:hypothetical protein